MGFFSFDCRVCARPMLSHHATNRINAWMNDVVVLRRRRVRPLEGPYDGYGRVCANPYGAKCGGLYRNVDILSAGQPECYHRACWILAGSPTEFSEPSDHSDDQGFFFPEGTHDIPKPAGGDA